MGDYDGPNLGRGVVGWGPRSGPGPTLTNTRDRLRFYMNSDYNNMKDILSLLFRTRSAQLIHKPQLIPDRVAFDHEWTEEIPPLPSLA